MSNIAEDLTECPDRMDIEADKGEALVFAGALMQQVNSEDVANMVQVQRGMLQRFEKTNEMLINFNQLSTLRYEASIKDFQQHTQLLYDMKKDLDSIFKRIRVLKQRLSKSYPEAFAAACSSIIMMEEENEVDVTPSTVGTTTTTTTTTSATATTTTGTQPAAHTHPASQSSRPASSSAAKRTQDHSGETGKATIAQPQKPQSRSAAGAKEEGGGVRKTGRSSTGTKSSAGSSCGGAHTHAPAKLI